MGTIVKPLVSTTQIDSNSVAPHVSFAHNTLSSPPRTPLRRKQASMHAIEYQPDSSNDEIKDCFVGLLRSNVKEKLEYFESLSANQM